MRKFIIIKEPAPIWVGPLIPVIAVVVTFIITAVFIIIAGANPFEAYYQSLIAPLSNKVSAIEVLVTGISAPKGNYSQAPLRQQALAWLLTNYLLTSPSHV
jgi:hypothetical protein